MRSPLFILFIFFAISSIPAEAQELSKQRLDTLTDEGLLDLFMEFDRDSIKQEQIARTYLERGRQQNDTIKMVRAYDRLSLIFDFEKNLKFTDSVLLLTKGKSHITYPANAYIHKAYLYNLESKISEAYDNLLTAYELAKKNNNVSQVLYILDRLVVIQLMWGNKKLALNRQYLRHGYLVNSNFKKELLRSTRIEAHDKIDFYINEQFLLSYRNFTICYLLTEQPDSSQVYLDKLKRHLVITGSDPNDYFETWIEEAQAEIFVLDRNYHGAMREANRLITKLHSRQDYSRDKNLHFIIGYSQLNLNQNERAIKNLLKADSLADSQPEINDYVENKKLFWTLHKYYLQNEDYPNAVNYIDKVLSLEEQIQPLLLSIEPNIIRDIDTPFLLKKKEELIDELEQKAIQRAYFQGITIGLLILSLTVAILYFKRQKAYKVRFLRILEESGSKHRDPKTVMLSSTITQEIMAGLDQFELREGYRDSRLSLNGLAKELNTNSNYLSRVINFKFEKNFSQYLHDLRVEYAKERLLKDEKFRRYTIRAIAEESGYNSVESFSRAFHKRLGIYPSFYVRSLNKKKATPGE